MAANKATAAKTRTKKKERKNISAAFAAQSQIMASVMPMTPIWRGCRLRHGSLGPVQHPRRPGDDPRLGTAVWHRLSGGCGHGGSRANNRGKAGRPAKGHRHEEHEGAGHPGGLLRHRGGEHLQGQEMDHRPQSPGLRAAAPVYARRLELLSHAGPPGIRRACMFLIGAGVRPFRLLSRRFACKAVPRYVKSSLFSLKFQSTLLTFVEYSYSICFNKMMHPAVLDHDCDGASGCHSARQELPQTKNRDASRMG